MRVAGAWRAAGAKGPRRLALKPALAVVGAALPCGLARLLPVLVRLFAAGLTRPGTGVPLARTVPRDPCRTAARTDGPGT